MSIMQRLTLIGLYNYDNTLFDGLTLPEAYDKSTFIESLMIEHGEKLVLYSDYDFMKYSIGAWGRKWSLELTRIAEALFAEYNPIWNYDRYEEWKDKGGKRGQSETGEVHNEESNTNASHVENASSNTGGSYIEKAKTSKTSDALSESEDSRISKTSSTDSKISNAENDSSHRLQNTPDYKEEKVTENVTNGETEHKVSADNDSDYQPASKDITNIGKNKVTDTASGTKDNITELNKSEGTTTENGEAASEETGRNNSVSSSSGSENTSNDTSGHTNEKANSEASGRNATSAKTEGGRNTTTNDSEVSNSDHVGHLWGNIGVTTSASMVTEVVEQRMKYNLYNTACRLFANELLIGIY